MDKGDLFFDSGTEPLGSGSQVCINVSINDDPFREPTERFTLCGTSQQNAVVILNGGCTVINVVDDEGKNKIENKTIKYF